MDPKVCGKLLTHHRRGYGVDVEALRDRFPSGGALERAPRWNLTGTEGCGEGNRISWCSQMFLGYMSIYRRRKEVGGATRVGGAPTPLGTPYLMDALLLP